MICGKDSFRRADGPQGETPNRYGLIVVRVVFFVFGGPSFATSLSPGRPLEVWDCPGGLVLPGLIGASVFKGRRSRFGVPSPTAKSPLSVLRREPAETR